QNAALVQEATTAAASLEEQARNLTAAVAAFDLGDKQTVLITPRAAVPALKRPALKASLPASSSHGNWETF
ncbi:methyl-accepting chemotaxis protein, partial [Dickeya solani]|nr:methyl-accepting chemotaxis protein [Dickeya solani]